jgi:hypothetical protein
MTNHEAAYTYCQVATRGCEIRSPAGVIVGWAVDDKWAALMVAGLISLSPQAWPAVRGRSLRPAT